MPAKKKPVTRKKKFAGAMETHRGNVTVYVLSASGEGATTIMSRDEALLFAFEIVAASSGLSRKEVAQHFAK